MSASAEESVSALKTSSEADVIMSASDEESVSALKPISSCKDSQTQMFDSLTSLNESISSLEEATKSNYIVLLKSKNFGNEDIKATGKEKIRWSSPHVKGEVLVSFTGIPYIVIGRKYLQCHLGTEFKRLSKTDDQNQHQDHLFIRQRRIIQNTKKMGCTAEIHILHIIQFPDFKIKIDTEKRRRISSKKLKLELLHKVDSVKAIHRYVARFPVLSDHTNHATTGEVANLREKLDIKVKEKFLQLHRSGVRKISEMRRHLNTFVKTEIFPGTDAPIEYRRRFCPTRKDICNIMAQSKSKTLNSSLDQSHLLSILDEWQKDNANLNIHCRPNTAANEERNTQTFLFCYQTMWQQRLLRLYGNNMTLFDATYRTTRYALPLFFLCVRTNVCYVVVGTFVTQYENSESIVEALNIFKSWNEDWNPSCFLVDFCLEEINAISKVFPGANILLCDFHREKAWMEWVNKKEHKVRDFRKVVLRMLRNIANVRSMEDHNAALEDLTNSAIWKKTPELRQWFSKKWLPEITKWARVYRHGMLQVGIHTNNGLERQHEILKYNHLEGYRNCSLSEMITVLHSSFFPNTYKKYVELNAQSSAEYRKYTDQIPKFLQNRPREIIKHIMNRMISTLDLKSISCVSSTKGIFEVNSESQKEKKYRVNLGGEIPFCTCEDWGNFLIPCKHMCCIFKFIEEWGWHRLSKSYTNNPLFSLDTHCLFKEIKEEKSEDLKSFNAFEMPIKENIQDLEQRRRSLRTKKIRHCHVLVKRLIDSLYLIRDIANLTKAENDLEKLVTSVNSLVPKDEGLPLLHSPKRKREEVESYEPLPKRDYGRAKHPASQRVGTKADMLREDVWDTVQEETIESCTSDSDICQDQLNDTWTIINNIKLTYQDKLDLEGNTWLDDKVINVCQYLISAQFPHVVGLTDTLLLAHCKVGQAEQLENLIQIHHVGAHWLVSHGSAAEVKIYDSLKTNVNDTLKKQILHLYRKFFQGEYSVLHINCLTFQRQKGPNDCGPFAIANAVCLAYGINVGDVLFEQEKMRAHIVSCIETQNMSMFPHSVQKISRAPMYSSKIRLSTYCICQLYKPTDKMLECSSCQMWFHFKCVGVNEQSSFVKTKRKKYICQKCSNT